MDRFKAGKLAASYSEAGDGEEDLNFLVPRTRKVTALEENDRLWTRIFASGEQREEEKVRHYCERVNGWAQGLTDVPQDFLESLVFYRVRAGLLDSIKSVLNAQIEQPQYLKDLERVAVAIEEQYESPSHHSPTASVTAQATAGSHIGPLQHPFDDRPSHAQGNQQLGSNSTMRGRHEAQSLEQSQGAKRKQTFDYDEDDIQEFLRNRAVQGNKKRQSTSKPTLRGAAQQGEKAQASSNLTWKERQDCKDKGVCFYCRQPGHMHLQCPNRVPQ
ncbi:MAG: hypothetical protein Q9181_003332 [Wetmoreana brouardii]